MVIYYIKCHIFAIFYFLVDFLIHDRQPEQVTLTWTGSPVGMTMAVGGGRAVTVLVMAESLGS